MISGFGQYGGSGQATRRISGPAMYERVRKGFVSEKSRIDSSNKMSAKSSELSSSNELLKISENEKTTAKNELEKINLGKKSCIHLSHINDTNIDTCLACGSEIMCINVSGLKFRTHASVLAARNPNSLLSNPSKRAEYYDSLRNEYFFERHRPSFEVIFCFLQTGGRLRRPPHIPDSIFYEELIFYELDEDAIAEYLRSEGNVDDDLIYQYPQHGNRCRGLHRLRSFLWTLFEFSDSSKLAKCVGLFSLLVTVFSIATFIVETLPVLSNITDSRCHDNNSRNIIQPFFLIEIICNFWFTLELVVRFLVCPYKRLFVRGASNWIDFLSVLPFYLDLIIMAASSSCQEDKRMAGWLSLLRVLRISRIFKLTKHSVGLQVLMDTLKASVGGLLLFLITLLVCTILYSSLLYYAEIEIQGSQVESIPHGFWWAVITMTTVGYGDVVPLGSWGKLIGMFCAVTGVLTLAIPIPIITNNFNKFYSFRTGKGLR